MREIVETLREAQALVRRETNVPYIDNSLLCQKVTMLL